MASEMTVANTILAQLGGNKFVAMTGGKHFLGSENSLQFQLPRGGKDGINAVRIVLEASDTYTVEFHKIGNSRNGYKMATVSSFEMVHADALRQVFTSATGLYTSL